MARQVVRAFLSHSYNAFEANVYLYDLISTVADFAFTIDEGGFSTSTTRLERMVRDADVFVGFWPLPGDPVKRPPAAELDALSRYFRLELDMAIRAGKPGIVLCDKRYGTRFEAPPEILHLRYDAQELAYGVESPSWPSLAEQVATFWAKLDQRLRLPRAAPPPSDAGRVGVLVAPDGEPDAAAIVVQAVADAGFAPAGLPWPPRLSASYLTTLRTCDWLVADVADPAVESLTAFLHGQFVPLLRIRREPAPAEPSPTSQVLYGALEAGYRKDVTRWRDGDDLRARLDERLEAICQSPILVGSRAAAATYFSSARKRDERVFLSYAGKDFAAVAEFANELRRRYDTVFDYRSGSIPAGREWRDVIAESIERSTIGVIFLTEHYEPSPHCLTEMRGLLDVRDAKRLTQLLVIVLARLESGKAPVPNLLKDIQYVDAAGATPAEIFDKELPPGV